jgi:hypothetical protein
MLSPGSVPSSSSLPVEKPSSIPSSLDVALSMNTGVLQPTYDCYVEYVAILTLMTDLESVITSSDNPGPTSIDTSWDPYAFK